MVVANLIKLEERNYDFNGRLLAPVGLFLGIGQRKLAVDGVRHVLGLHHRQVVENLTNVLKPKEWPKDYSVGGSTDNG